MERARKGVAILLNNVLHSVVIVFRCVSSRILWIKFKFSRVKVCVIVGSGPNEGIGEEKERFWSDIDRTVYRVGNSLQSTCVALMGSREATTLEERQLGKPRLRLSGEA